MWMNADVISRNRGVGGTQGGAGQIKKAGEVRGDIIGI